GGSAKTILSYHQLRHEGLFEHDASFAAEERLRLQVAATSPWLRIEIADEASLTYQTLNPASVLLPDFNPTSAWDWQWTLYDSQRETKLFHRLDRAYVQIR